MREENRSREERLVSVLLAPDEAAATMICDFLREQGIDAASVSAQMPWFGSIEKARRGYWGQVEVLEHDAERARALIEDFYAARPERDPVAASDENEEEGA